MAAISVLFPLFTLSTFAFETLTTKAPAVDSQTHSQSIGPKPDIYYIILDGYSRADALEELYGYDNSQFIQQLESLGFFVASCSVSNYSQTLLSVSSSMNMDYLQKLDPAYSDPQHNGRAALPDYIQHGAVRQFLERLGYRTVAFDSGLTWTNLNDADVFLKSGGRSVAWMGMLQRINEFEALLLDTSAALILTDATVKLPEIFQPKIGLKRLHRERVLGDEFNGDLVVFGGNVTIEENAALDGSLVVFGGTVYSDGNVNGDVVVIGGQVKLDEQTLVTGDVVTIGGQVQQAEGAVVQGEVINNVAPEVHLPNGQIPPVDVPSVPLPEVINWEFNPFWEFGRVLGSALIVSFLGILAALFFQDRLDRASQAIVSQPLMTTSIGLLTIVVMIIAAFTIVLLRLFSRSVR